MNIVRKLVRNWKWFLINLLGLGTAMACVLTVFLFTRHEIGYDGFHKKADRIYRITLDSNRGATSMHPARVAGDLPEELKKIYPEIEDMVRLIPFRKAFIKIGEQKFFTEKAFSTDSSFFRVFDFKILTGNPETALTQPGQAFISRGLAMKYFGTLDVVGKVISILHQKELTPRDFTIAGVMEDFPVQSHFHAELLTSLTDDVENRTTWAYTYFLMKSGTDVANFVKTVQQQMDKENTSGEVMPLVYLQKITDIHLYSHKTREMERNGNIRTLYLLGTGTFIILLIALANYLNLSLVQFYSRIKSVKVKVINGASKARIAREIISESLILSLVSSAAGCYFAFRMCEIIGIPIHQSDSIAAMAVMVVIMILVVALISVIPLFSSGEVSSTKIKGSRGRLYTIPLVVQYALAVVAITGTLVLHRQIGYMTSQHPASQSSNLLIIPNNPTEVVQRYDLLKAELLKLPEVANVTSALEPPGGDILDNFEFEMEGIEKREGQTLNILTTDIDFFSILGIKPLAGTTDLGVTPSLQWETDATNLSSYRRYPGVDPALLADLEKRVGIYREKYILNQSALNMLGITNPQEAIGKRFRLNWFMSDLFPEGEVVAVVPDFHYTNLHSQEKPLVIISKKMFNSCFIISLNPGQSSLAIPAIGPVWEKLNPGYPMPYEFMSDSYRQVYSDEYAQSRVLSLFALISIILSALGMFALAAFTMQRRVKEIGVRKINGARVWEVMLMLNTEFLKWVFIGFLLAIPVAWYALHRWLEGFAYRISLSWWIFGLAGIFALGIALLTVSWLSWRAATRNPVESLRYE